MTGRAPAPTGAGRLESGLIGGESFGASLRGFE